MAQLTLWRDQVQGRTATAYQRTQTSAQTLSLVALAAILVFQTVIAMLSMHNSAFQDEALYVYAGREYFEYFFMGGEAIVEPYALYFSGLPYFYPVIAGGLDVYFGIEGARFFSLICMLVVTASAFFITRKLFDVNSALFGAALYAVQGSVLFLSRLATYDALCLALAALATVAALYASERRGILLTLLVGVLLFGAIAAKYAGLMFIPAVIVILTWRTFTQLGLGHAIFKTLLAVGVIVGLTILVLVLDPQVYVGVTATTTDRQALLETPRLLLAGRALEQGGLIMGLALIGLLLAGWNWRSMPLRLLFFATIFIAPVYHIYKMESFSLHKHLAYGLFFGAPLAGYAVARLSGYVTQTRVGKRWLFGLAICTLAFGIGFTQARGFFAEWADSRELIDLMRTQVRPGSGRYLAEESEVMRYYLQDVVEGWQWNQLYWFYYTDNDGSQLQGIPAYQAAIDDAYFDLIVLRYGPAVNTALAIDDALYEGTNYELIAQIPYFTMFGEGHYWVWRRDEDLQFAGREQVSTSEILLDESGTR